MEERIMEQTEKIQVFQPGAIIIQEGTPGSEMYLIQQGTVEVSIESEDRKRIVLAALGPGEFFGEMEFYEEKSTCSARVTALSEVHAFSVSKDDLTFQLQTLPHWFQILIKELINRVRRTNKTILNEMKSTHEHFEQERLQTLLEIAGTYAHVVNQHLSIIKGYAELLERELKDERYRDNLQKIIDSCDRIVEFEQKMLTIRHYSTKPYVGESKILDVE